MINNAAAAAIKARCSKYVVLQELLEIYGCGNNNNNNNNTKSRAVDDK